MPGFLGGLFDSNEKELKRLQPYVDRINELEPDFQKLSDEELKAKTQEFKARVAEAVSGVQPRLDEAQHELEEARKHLTGASWELEKDEASRQVRSIQDRIKQIEKERHKLEGEVLDEILPEAFAAVREAARRTIGQRHYDVQLLGGVTLHQGKIAEMKTGEGKTLVATLPLYLNSLTGRGAHLVTVNDYLSRRDPYWMGPIYHALGVTVASIYPMQNPDEYTPACLFDPSYDSGKENDRWRHFRPISRQEAYRADITYGTSSEFGFDYLRDNMVADLSRCVQRQPLYYAIVDEVDNLLIDEARTPLIISGPAEETGALYKAVDDVVNRLKIKVLASETPMHARNEEEEAALEAEFDAVAYEKEHYVRETGRGQEKLARAFHMRAVDLFGGEGGAEAGYLSIDEARKLNDIRSIFRQSLNAHGLFRHDRDYVVENGEVVIVDEFTGRKMYGRRYSEGLHQAIEAKEHVKVQRESLTFATITIQNYFRMYEKLAGMTGTAATEAEEFYKIYKLEVTTIPTNIEFRAQNDELQTFTRRENGAEVTTYQNKQTGEIRWKRIDYPDLIYKTEEGKRRAVVGEIKEAHEKGRPVLVGTTSIENSVKLSDMLKRQNISCEVLNAKQHEREGHIIDNAGKRAAVTVATNMAGRGVDIILGGRPPDYKPEEDLQDYIFRKSHEFIEKAELFLKDEEGYAERKEEHQRNLKKYDNEIKRAADSIKYIYLSGESPEISSDNDKEIIKLEEDIRQYSKEYLFEFLSWETEVEQKLKRKSEEIADIEKSNILQKIKDVFGLKSKEDKLRREIDEIIYGHRPFKEWRKEHFKIIELGGLHIIGTERHEARRIDNQLRGRSGRQGDPGSSRFYVSLEDDIMRRFGGDRLKTVMGWVGMDENTPIENKIITGAITDVQKRVEGYHFDMRKHLVEFDDVVNTQRTVIYEERRKILSGTDLKSNILSMVERELKNIVAAHAPGRYDESRDGAGLLAEVNIVMPLSRDLNEKSLESLSSAEIEKKLIELAEALYDQREKDMGPDKMRLLERLVMLQIIDRLWIEHLTAMEHMRLQAGWAALQQMKSTDAYKSTGYQQFQTLLETIRHDVAHTIFHVNLVQKEAKAPQSPMAKAGVGSQGNSRPKSAAAVAGKKIGRNDPCPCGSGKKYKHCCGK